jgi:hypothetical protein
VGEWNNARIVVDGTRREHWINGILVLAYDLTSESYRTALEASIHRQQRDFIEPRPGNIVLLSFVGEVGYRNLRIKELPVSAAR